MEQWREDVLIHYGVLGMKWGVRKNQHAISRLEYRNSKLSKKIDKYNLKSAKFGRRAENAHSKYDLGTSNKWARKAGRYAVKAARGRAKMNQILDPVKKAKMNQKVEEQEYKYRRYATKANKIAKLTGYGSKAMKLSIKSDKFAAKAAKAEMKMARNNRKILLSEIKMAELGNDENIKRKSN